VTPSWRIIVGDAAQTVSTLPAASVQCCVTSPPYYSLRDYGVDGQIGLEDTPDEYVQRLVGVFREVRRVLRDDGTVWINLGDSYAATSTYSSARSMHTEAGWKQAGRRPGSYAGPKSARSAETAKPKDLLGIPWLVAFALRADGWYLRQEIIWAKTAPMPESVRDRCTRAHEMVFMLSKRPTYFYDQEAIKQPSSDPGRENGRDGRDEDERARPPGSRPRTLARRDYREHGANRRSVWTLGPEPFADAHFAVMPGRLARDCLLAGSPERCCGTCGAPWERVVSGEPSDDDGAWLNEPGIELDVSGASAAEVIGVLQEHTTDYADYPSEGDDRGGPFVGADVRARRPVRFERGPGPVQRRRHDRRAGAPRGPVVRRRGVERAVRGARAEPDSR
jgi:DNA modification methylase